MCLQFAGAEKPFQNPGETGLYQVQEGQKSTQSQFVTPEESNVGADFVNLSLQVIHLCGLLL